MNTYSILPTTNHDQFKFVIVSGETVISAHETKGEAEEVKAAYEAGEKVSTIKNHTKRGS